MSSSNNNQDFEFNRDKQEFSLANKNSSQNPFLENNSNPKNTAQPDYEVSNERIKDNKKQTKGLAKILLALLLATGIIIVAILGLIGKNKAAIAPNQNISAWDSNDKNTNKPAFKWPWQKNANNNSANSPEQSNTSGSVQNNAGNINSPPANNSPNNKTATLNPSSDLPVSATDGNNKTDSCKLSDAQKYISASVNDLDRVVGLAENKLDILNASNSPNKTKEAEFLKNKVNDLSKAESDIYAFSEPHLDRDSANINIDDYNSSCGINDGPKYLNAWLDQLGERIKSLDAELSYLNSPSAETPIASPIDNNTIANNNTEQPQPEVITQKTDIPKTSPKATASTNSQTAKVNSSQNNTKNNISKQNQAPNNTKQKSSLASSEVQNQNNNLNKKNIDKNKNTKDLNKEGQNTTSIINNNSKQKSLAQADLKPQVANKVNNNLNTSYNLHSGNSAKNNTNYPKPIKPKEKIIPNYISIVPPSQQAHTAMPEKRPRPNLIVKPESRIISRCDNNIRQIPPVQDNYYSQNLPIRRCTSDYEQHYEPEYDYYEEYVYEYNDYN